MDGFLLVNKPAGLTSHDVVYKLKKKLNADKIGHTGTLDPFADGLLILCLGKATKLAHLFSNLDKVYTGTIIFGNHYDTYDVTGKIMMSNPPSFSVQDLHQAIKSLQGSYDQVPPMYSAIKQQGRKLYDIARSGIEVDRASREVQIKRFDATSELLQDEITFLAEVSKGTYIRSLAVDLASRLDTYAALKTLTRVSVGEYHIKDAKTISDITLADVISLEVFFKDMNRVILNDYMVKLVQNGVYLDGRQTDTDHPFIVTDMTGKPIAYYEVLSPSLYRPVLIF
jgi:tRNA pseudouridine55 synthase